MEKHKTILITGEEPCSADGKPGGLARPRLLGKAFAGLLVDISAGRYAAGVNVLFIMTVGSPGLYAYARDFLGADHKDST